MFNVIASDIVLNIIMFIYLIYMMRKAKMNNAQLIQMSKHAFYTQCFTAIIKRLFIFLVFFVIYFSIVIWRLCVYLEAFGLFNISSVLMIVSYFIFGVSTFYKGIKVPLLNYSFLEKGLIE